MAHPTDASPTPKTALSSEALDDLQKDAFGYFMEECNTSNGLVIDKTRENWPASIAATAAARMKMPVLRGFMAVSFRIRVPSQAASQLISSSA